MGVLAGGVRAQRPGTLAVAVAFWPILLAIAGLAVDLRVVRSHRGAVQAFPAAHCVRQRGPVSELVHELNCKITHMLTKSVCEEPIITF